MKTPIIAALLIATCLGGSALAATPMTDAVKVTLLKAKWSMWGTKNILKLTGPRAAVRAAVARLRKAEINPGGEKTFAPSVFRNPFTGTTRVRYFSSQGMLSNATTNDLLLEAVYPGSSTAERKAILSGMEVSTVSNPQTQNWHLTYTR